MLILSLDGHIHLDGGMWFVANQLEVLELERVNVSYIGVDTDLGEGLRSALDLLLERLDVVRVDVSIAESVHELTALQATNLSEHQCQQCIASDVERNAQSHIARSTQKEKIRFVNRIEGCG